MDRMIHIDRHEESTGASMQFFNASAQKQTSNEWNATLMEMQVFINRSVKTSNFTIYLLIK